MNVIEFGLIVVGFFLQICVFMFGLVLGAALAIRGEREQKKTAAQKQYEAASRFWHTPQSVEKN
jgi:heme/copper-type cytochrome/quinol oxidase subunit 3